MDTYVTVMATVLTGMGVLFGVWRLVTAAIDGVRRDLTAAVDSVRKDLTAEIRAVTQRIDAVLLADRNARTN